MAKRIRFLGVCICACAALLSIAAAYEVLPEDTPEQKEAQRYEEIERLITVQESQLVIAATDAYLKVHANAPEFHNLRGRAYMQLGEFDKALADFAEALRLRQSAGYLSNHAVALSSLGQEKKALADLKQAVALEPSDDRMWTNLADSQLKLGQIQEALDSANKALKLSPRRPEALDTRGQARIRSGDVVGGMTDRHRANGLREVYQMAQDAYLEGDSLCRGLRPDLAVDHYRRAIRLFRGYHAADHLDVARVLNRLGRAYHDSGQLGLAAQQFQSAERMLQDLYGDDIEDLATFRNDYGQLCMALGWWDEAAERFDAIVDIQRKRFGPRSIHHLSALNSCVVLEWSRRAVPLPEKDARDILDTVEHEHGVAQIQDVSFLTTYFQILRQQGPADALPPIVQKIEQLCAAYPGHPRTVFARRLLSECYVTQHELDKARTTLEAAMEIARAHDDVHEIAATAEAIGWLYAERGDWEAASRHCDEYVKNGLTYASGALRGLSEQQQVHFVRFDPRMKFGEIAGLSLAAPQNSRVSGRTAEWILNGKGLITDVLTTRALEAQRLKDLQGLEAVRVETQLKQLGELRRQIAITLQGPELAGQRRELVADEQALSAQLGASLDLPLSNAWVTVDDVAGRLPEDGVLIEMALLTPPVVSKREPQPAHYGAWIIWPRSKKRDVLFLDLGLAEQIDPLISKAHDKGWIVGLESQKISRQILAPLIQIGGIAEAKRWIVSPVGRLWRFPFEAMIWPDTKAKFAVERADISYVISGRDLTVRHDSLPTTAPAVVAPFFGAIPENQQNDPDVAALLDPAPLMAISRAMTGQAPSLLASHDAMRLFDLKRPRLLWVTTHGVLRGADEGTAVDHHLEGTPMADPVWARPLNVNPLQDVLLQMSPTDPLGTTTALDLANIDLRGTALVGLAVCNADRGILTSPGESMASLRQVLHRDGALNVLAALATIPPDPSYRLLTRFGELLQNQPNVDLGRVLSEAKRLHLRQAREARANDPQSARKTSETQPGSWAALTLTTVGDLNTPFGPGQPAPPLDKPQPPDDQLTDEQIDALVQQADGLSARNQFADALQLYNQALGAKPNHILGRNGRAGAALALEDVDSAIRDLTELVTLDAMNANAWRNRAVAYLENGQFDQAIGDLKSAIQLDSRSSSSFFLLSEAYWLKGIDDESDKAMKAAWELKVFEDADERFRRKFEQ